MRFLKKIPYKLKTALPALALAGSAMMTASCEKEEPDLGPTTDVEYKFSSADMDLLFTNYEHSELNSTLKYYINHPDIRTIYLTPAIHDVEWKSMKADKISIFKKYYMEPIINYSQKIRGKGDFNFKPGEASKVPNDSLWFIQNGWTINKALQYQK